jgi:hypothetical protein
MLLFTRLRPADKGAYCEIREVFQNQECVDFVCRQRGCMLCSHVDIHSLRYKFLNLALPLGLPKTLAEKRIAKNLARIEP